MKCKSKYLKIVDGSLHSRFLLSLHLLVQGIHHALISRLECLLERLREKLQITTIKNIFSGYPILQQA